MIKPAHKHPGLRLEVLSGMHYLDLARGEADLALRVRPPTQPELKLVHTLTLKNSVFVSRALAKKLPRKPKLTDLPWVAWAPPYDQLPPNPQLQELMPDYVPAFTSDHFLVNLAAAEAGLGAMVLAGVKHRFSRVSATLVPVPVDLGPYTQTALHFVCAKSALEIPRVRLVAELLVEELKRTS